MLETTESFNAGWVATIGERAVKAYRVDGWRQAWLVPAGVGGTVRLVYEPDSRYRTGLVSHNDVYPANVVFRDGRAVALIDFDLAGPGSAVWDFAAAARLFVPLLDEADVTDSRSGRALERFRIFLAASGLPRAARLGVVGALLDNHDWTYAIVTEAAAAGHQGFADHWRAVAEPASRARRWAQRHQRDLLAAAR